MDPKDEFPRIETTERGYREFLRTHPRREHLRRAEIKDLTVPLMVIYDFEKFSASGAHAKSPTRFAVATRSFDSATQTYVFHIMPNGPRLVW